MGVKVKARLTYREWSQAMDRRDMPAVREAERAISAVVSAALTPAIEEAFRQVLFYGAATSFFSPEWMGE